MIINRFKTAALTLFCLFAPSVVFAQTDNSEDFIKKAEERNEQVGVKIGMKKEEVMKILGPSYVQEKLKNLETKDYVYSWHKPNGDFVSVTFAEDKVKAVSHMLHVEPTKEK